MKKMNEKAEFVKSCKVLGIEPYDALHAKPFSIWEAYFAAARKLYPDFNPNLPAEKFRATNPEFMELMNAYDFLVRYKIDFKKRAKEPVFHAAPIKKNPTRQDKVAEEELKMNEEDKKFLNCFKILGIEPHDVLQATQSSLKTSFLNAADKLNQDHNLNFPAEELKATDPRFLELKNAYNFLAKQLDAFQKRVKELILLEAQSKNEQPQSKGATEAELADFAKLLIEMHHVSNVLPPAEEGVYTISGGGNYHVKMDKRNGSRSFKVLHPDKTWHNYDTVCIIADMLFMSDKKVTVGNGLTEKIQHFEPFTPTKKLLKDAKSSSNNLIHGIKKALSTRLENKIKRG
ncbi:MAG: hypothetical protein LBL34_01280 [Clostridiales bacterium]|jgi:DnaJ-class molecular chaperone|nr:hypothetical protein [Clostridiales bacterium]